jgi:hypothetical protein
MSAPLAGDGTIDTVQKAESCEEGRKHISHKFVLKTRCPFISSLGKVK